MFSWSSAECGVFLCEVFCFFRFQRKISTNVAKKWNYKQSLYFRGLESQCNAHDEEKAIKLRFHRIWSTCFRRFLNTDLLFILFKASPTYKLFEILKCTIVRSSKVRMLSRVVLVIELMVIVWIIIYNCSWIYKNKYRANSFLVKIMLNKSIPLYLFSICRLWRRVE